MWKLWRKKKYYVLKIGDWYLFKSIDCSDNIINIIISLFTSKNINLYKMISKNSEAEEVKL